MPHREEAPGKTQDTLERLCLSAGLGTPRGPSGRAGGRVWGEGAIALLDSGSAGNFISGALCRQLQLKTTTTPKIYQIHSVTGKPLCQVRYIIGPLHLQVGILHMEEIHLLVLEDSMADMILGCPWLEQHNPIIS
ncbi:hypothetical protein QTP70_002151 [Hemibagrus guttatus]|uniref:Uncharacterized protein n=1 Tax=Hemibagrus guttatus TaxID=175788 RepID=A0AAE0UHR6_9TELE|nr:hypothetical protein QTP70_002151 [Hemibagrus guttatus]